jgi:hypothetical protein
MGWAYSKQVDIGNTYNALIGEPKGKRSLGEPGVVGRIILKWILKK